MTVVIAQIRNDEILIQADTKISDAHQRLPDTMPGRLKIVTLGHRFTVAFAGNADPAHLAIRQTAKCISNKQFAEAIECIKGDGQVNTTLISSSLPISPKLNCFV